IGVDGCLGKICFGKVNDGGAVGIRRRVRAGARAVPLDGNAHTALLPGILGTEVRIPILHFPSVWSAVRTAPKSLKTHRFREYIPRPKPTQQGNRRSNNVFPLFNLTVILPIIAALPLGLNQSKMVGTDLNTTDLRIA